MSDHKCSYCKRELRGRYWINYAPFHMLQTAQCDRWWCRLLSGHLLWLTTGWSFHWIRMTILLPLPKVTIPWPTLRKLR